MFSFADFFTGSEGTKSLSLLGMLVGCFNNEGAGGFRTAAKPKTDVQMPLEKENKKKLENLF